MKKPIATRKLSRQGAKAENESVPKTRTFGMKSVGAILTPVTKPVMSRRSAIAMQLVLEWSDIVGTELARLSAPRKLGGGTLTIACAGPAAVELQFLAPQLLERVNKMVRGGGRGHDGQAPLRFSNKDDSVARIRFVHDTAFEQIVTPPPRVVPDPLPVVAGDSEVLNDILGRLGALIRRRDLGL